MGFQKIETLKKAPVPTPLKLPSSYEKRENFFSLIFFKALNKIKKVPKTAIFGKKSTKS